MYFDTTFYCIQGDITFHASHKNHVRAVNLLGVSSLGGDSGLPSGQVVLT